MTQEHEDIIQGIERFLQQDPKENTFFPVPLEFDLAEHLYQVNLSSLLDLKTYISPQSESDREIQKIANKLLCREEILPLIVEKLETALEIDPETEESKMQDRSKLIVINFNAREIDFMNDDLLEIDMIERETQKTLQPDSEWEELSKEIQRNAISLLYALNLGFTNAGGNPRENFEEFKRKRENES